MLARSFSDNRSLTERVKRFFGLDEESQRQKREKEIMKKTLGEIIENSGLFGRLWSRIISYFAAQILGT